jgi:hypothetical protein
MSNPHPEEKFLTKAEVLKRGWTVASISKILGSPDKNTRNPVYRSAPPVQLFQLNRVEEAERSPEFLEWKQKNSKKQISARLVAKQKKEAVEAEKARVSRAWEDLKPLSQWLTADWIDFTWDRFIPVRAKLSEEEKMLAVNAVRKMLQESYWVRVKLFFESFAHYGEDCSNTDEKVAKLAEQIASEGWRGIPLVSFFLEDKVGRFFLESGHHRWIALKRLLDSGKISEDFRVPVFDLRDTPRCFDEEEYKERAFFALALLERGELRLCRKLLSLPNTSDGNLLMGLCTGMDGW